MAPSTGARQTSLCGNTAVTPVRTGPSPFFKGPSPRTIVEWPTRTPSTSVIALSGPGAQLAGDDAEVACAHAPGGQRLGQRECANGRHDGHRRGEVEKVAAIHAQSWLKRQALATAQAA